jgi:hypothetical protein
VKLLWDKVSSLVRKHAYSEGLAGQLPGIRTEHSDWVLDGVRVPNNMVSQHGGAWVWEGSLPCPQAQVVQQSLAHMLHLQCALSTTMGTAEEEWVWLTSKAGFVASVDHQRMHIDTIVHVHPLSMYNPAG